MRITNHKIIANRIKIFSILLVVLIATLCRYVGLNGFMPKEMGVVRGILQCALIGCWAFSINKRILNIRVRTHLIFIAGLLMLWLAARTVKYTFFDGTEVLYQYLWYLFYIPMEFIPLLGLFVALYIGRPEDYTLPTPTRLLLVPTALIVAMILTNQSHEFVFINPELASNYQRGMGYFIAIGWMAILVISFLTVLHKRSRIPGKSKRIILPMLPVIFGVVYSIAYILWFDIIKPYAGDMTAVLTYVMTLTFEGCIYTGLIQSNSKYDELFMKTHISAQLIDGNNRVYLSSETAKSIPCERIPKEDNASVVLPDNIRLSKKAIKGGSVLWTEDMTNLTSVISELEDLQLELKSKHDVLKEEYNLKHRAESLKERNRLYNIMQDQTKDRVLRLKQLSNRLMKTVDKTEIYRIVSEMALLAAYLKRRNNLIFIAEENNSISADEICNSFNESLRCFMVQGICFDTGIEITGSYTFEIAARIYDAFQTVIESSLHQISDLFVSITENNSAVSLRLIFTCTKDLSHLLEQGFFVSRDDDEWTIEYVVQMGGDGI